MADDQQQFCLRWNDFQSNMVNSFKHLRDEKSFTDVTLGNIKKPVIPQIRNEHLSLHCHFK